MRAVDRAQVGLSAQCSKATDGEVGRATERDALLQHILESYGVPVTVRDTRGREIDGACGQLATAERDSTSSAK